MQSRNTVTDTENTLTGGKGDGMGWETGTGMYPTKYRAADWGEPATRLSGLCGGRGKEEGSPQKRGHVYACD